MSDEKIKIKLSALSDIYDIENDSIPEDIQSDGVEVVETFESNMKKVDKELEDELDAR